MRKLMAYASAVARLQAELAKLENSASHAVNICTYVSVQDDVWLWVASGAIDDSGTWGEDVAEWGRDDSLVDTFTLIGSKGTLTLRFESPPAVATPDPYVGQMDGTWKLLRGGGGYANLTGQGEGVALFNQSEKIVVGSLKGTVK